MSENVNWVEFVGSISPEDIENGSVLIFRIDDSKYPKHVLDKVVESIKASVSDMFEGQVKAMILPAAITVEVLPNILKEKMEDGE